MPGTARPFRLISAATNNATVVKSTAGEVWAIWAANISAAIRFLKFYDKATAPNPLVDTPVFVCGVPGNTAGAGGSLPFPRGMAFNIGIGIVVVTGIADTDNTATAANEVAVSIAFL